MSKKDLSKLPKDLKVIEVTWLDSATSLFYEESKGFEVIVEVKNENSTGYIHILITWRQILAAMKRYVK